MTRLNRDTTTLNKDLYDGSISTSVDATLDHRLLSAKGRDDIAKELKINTIVVDNIVNTATKDSREIKDIFSNIDKSVTMFETINNTIQNNEELKKMLYDPTISPQQKDMLYSTLVQQSAIALGYLPPDYIVVSSDTTGKNDQAVKGHYNNGVIFLNDKNIDSIQEGAAVSGHELGHYIDDMENTIWKSEILKEENTNIIGAEFSDYISYTTEGKVAVTNNHTQPQSLIEYIQLQKDNEQFSNVDKSAGEDRVTIYSRPVVEIFNIKVNHIFGVIDKREGGKPDMIFSLGDNGNMLKGGTPIVGIEKLNDIVAKNDGSISENDKLYFLNGYSDKQIITIPEGMTQEDFDNKVLEGAKNYDTEKNQYPKIKETIIAGLKTYYGSNNNPHSKETNSNTFIDNVIEQAGGDIKDFNNAPLQNAGEDAEKEEQTKAILNKILQQQLQIGRNDVK